MIKISRGPRHDRTWTLFAYLGQGRAARIGDKPLASGWIFFEWRLRIDPGYNIHRLLVWGNRNARFYDCGNL